MSLTVRERKRLTELLDKGRAEIKEAVERQLFEEWLENPLDTDIARSKGLLDKVFIAITRVTNGSS